MSDKNSVDKEEVREREAKKHAKKKTKVEGRNVVWRASQVLMCTNFIDFKYGVTTFCMTFFD